MSDTKKKASFDNGETIIVKKKKRRCGTHRQEVMHYTNKKKGFVQHFKKKRNQNLFFLSGQIWENDHKKIKRNAETQTRFSLL